MKIGFDATKIVERKTAVGIYAYELLHQFAQMDLKHSFELFHNTLATLPAHVPFVYPLHTSIQKNSIIWNNFHLPKMMKQLRPDLYHAPFNFEGPIIKSCPLIITVHDLIPVMFPRYVNLKFSAIAALYYRLILPKADVIITASESTKQDIVRLYGYEEKIRVIADGLSERFKPVNERTELKNTLKRLGLPAEYLLFVGTIDRRKNILTLIDSYKRLRDEVSDVPPLVLIGLPSKGFKEIESAINKNNLTNAVYMIDYVPDVDLPAIYTGALVFVFPSLYEGFGFPPLEAMACGCPVVCSNSSSLPEVIGDAGVLVSPKDSEAFKDAIKKILSESDYALSLSRRGLKRVSLFSWRDTAKKTIAVYEDVLSR